MTSILMTLVCLVAADSEKYFAITVVDEATGRGVPLVELRTVHDITYYTDSQGVVAFFEPGLMDQEVFFTVTSHGYKFPADTFGFRGTKLKTTPGTDAKLTIRRVNIAERLYRITGAGIDADSKLVGKQSPHAAPLLNAQVIGSDSVQQALFQKQIYWFWGDTNRPSYPLGNFHVPGATSKLPSSGGLDPSLGVQLKYFVDENGFAKSTCQMPGEGPTWVDGLAVIQEPSGTERMFGLYLKVKPPLTIYEYGIAEFESDQQQFAQRRAFPSDAPFYPAGHAFNHSIDGQAYVYFCRPFPLSRVRASADSLQDLSQYEAFTCLAPGSSAKDQTLERDANGRLRYGWKRNTAPLTPELHKRLLRSGKIRADESTWNFCNIETAKTIRIHHGSLYWNEYRKLWVMIASEGDGTSKLGEVWYAEATAPEGPWGYCRKIVTHDRQSFYNPKHHPVFNQQGGRIIYFEGTYTNSFSGNDERTPRYNYNQVMYRMDLDDPRLVLPRPVYRQQTDEGEVYSFTPPPNDPTFGNVAFLACDRPIVGSVGIIPLGHPASGLANTIVDRSPKVIFHALLDSARAPAGTVLLFEFTNKQGQKRYRTGDQALDGFERGKPICRVWENPA